jgi:hypothetical protein
VDRVQERSKKGRVALDGVDEEIIDIIVCDGDGVVLGLAIEHVVLILVLRQEPRRSQESLGSNELQTLEDLAKSRGISGGHLASGLTSTNDNQISESHTVGQIRLRATTATDTDVSTDGNTDRSAILELDVQHAAAERTEDATQGQGGLFEAFQVLGGIRTLHDTEVLIHALGALGLATESRLSETASSCRIAV